MAFDVQQGLLEEGQPLDLMLLALVKHLLHALHVLRGALIQLLQRLLILFFSLRQKTQKAENWSLCGEKPSMVALFIIFKELAYLLLDILVMHWSQMYVINQNEQLVRAMLRQKCSVLQKY